MLSSLHEFHILIFEIEFEEIIYLVKDIWIL